MEDVWADPESLLGRLQRGRGSGFRCALSADGAARPVLGCIADDPRWDRDTDDRAGYYARLVMRLGIPAAAVEVDVLDPDLPSGLAFAVLVELARAGSGQAAAVLHEYLARAPEPQWWVVDEIWRDGGPAAKEGLRDLVLGRIDHEDLTAAVTTHDDGPWSAWADHPRVAAALAAAPAPPGRPVPLELGDKTTADLRTIAAGPPSHERSAAFRELSRRGDDVLLDLAERTDLRSGWGFVPALRAPVVDLGVATLARARAWLDGGDEWLQVLGKEVISTHGGIGDAPSVLEWFDEAVTSGDWCFSEVLAGGLARLGHRPALGSLADAWRRTPHSLARRHYLPALVELVAPDAAEYLDEARDDCEPDVRAIASSARRRR